jgi:immunity protein 27 of polymorphic toxin system
MTIGREETEIRGRWKMAGFKVEEDANARRIQTLISGYLREVAQDESGWSTLYVDPSDGRYWELTYPEGSSHGGGPPLLKVLSEQQAKARYRF